MAKIYEHDFKQRHTKKRLSKIADIMKEAQQIIGFKMSTRGWCYWAEGERIINKDQFDKFEQLINRCRKRGLLPIDFIAEEEGRRFSGVDKPYSGSHEDFVAGLFDSVDQGEDWFNPNWWEDEEYYIQMVVEKIDLKSMFYPVCSKYHIPIATSKGWSSMIQRATYARRYKEAEDKGLKCVLLYCGDHDPDGLRIAEFLRKNIDDLKNIHWEDGEMGYDPSGLIIERFGLTKEFIEEHKLTWIDNLITGSGKNLASPAHKNNKLDYVQDYLANIGERKCEANATVTIPKLAREMCKESILSFLGKGALARFKKKEVKNKTIIEGIKTELGWDKFYKESIDKLFPPEEE